MAKLPQIDGTDSEALARAIEVLVAELSPKLPDLEVSELIMHLEALLRPVGTGRRFFLKETRPGVFVL